MSLNTDEDVPIFDKVIGAFKAGLGKVGIKLGKEGISLEKRRIYVNVVEEQLDNHDFQGLPYYPPNIIKTYKYSMISFIPRNLFEQFRRVANLYFLLTVILQAFPEFGAASPIMAAMPLMVILAITAVKDGIEDLRRHRSDKVINESETATLAMWKNENFDGSSGKSFFPTFSLFSSKKTKRVILCECDEPAISSNETEGIGEGMCETCCLPIKERTVFPNNLATPEVHWDSCLWQDVKVGDFIYIRRDERIPADVLVLSTSNDNGIAFVETKGLDGETNLKPRESLKDTLFIQTAKDCTQLKMYVDMEAPNANLYNLNGKATYIIEDTPRASPSEGKPSPLYSRNATVRTVPINIVNVMLRGSSLRNTEWAIGLILTTGDETKILLNSGATPSKRAKVEKQMNPQVIFNFMFLFIMCIICSIMYSVKTRPWVRDLAPWVDPTQNVGTVAFQTFWASLIMLQNIVPISLYVTVEGVRTLQAFFIYSDIGMYNEDTDEQCICKTWTISDDLGQIEYVFSDKTGTLTQNKMEFRRCCIESTVYGEGLTDVSADKMNLSTKEREIEMERLTAVMKAELKEIYDSPYLPEVMSFVDSNVFRDFKNNPAYIYNFFLHLAICHTAPTPTIENDVIKYSAPSPDEQALIAGARDAGFTFLDRQQDIIHVDALGTVLEFRILNILEFNSARKRMSIIIQKPDGSKQLLCKGADSIIYNLLKKGQEQLMSSTMIHLDSFANEGLRTLCIAYRDVTDQEYEHWQKIYHTACTSLENRQELLDDAADLIERDLILLGATAIEDKLQENVPDVIQLLRDAGMKVWVLTGDKMETAINIGFASNLLSRDMDLLIVKGNTEDAVYKQIGEAVQRTSSKLQVREYALIIDGESLSHCFESQACKELLLELGTRCKSVICCRVSPKQKALVVRLVKRGKNAMCLAIGDGANDVSMIQEANVGVGISGQEGLQAAMASDYVIAQFKFLARLLLIHGSWSYYRITQCVSSFFYKNMCWVFAIFWYQFFTGFSATILYDYTFLMFYNLLFTSLPPIVLGIFDQHVNSSFLLNAPHLYITGIKGARFKYPGFFLNIFDALYQSVICFFLGFAAAHIIYNGHPIGLKEMGTCIAFSVILCVNFGMVFASKSWTWIIIVSFLLSVVGFILYVPVYAAFSSSTLYQIARYTYTASWYWLTALLALVVALGPHMLINAIKVSFFPNDEDIIRERQKYNMGPIPIKSEEIVSPILGESGLTTPIIHEPIKDEKDYKNEFYDPIQKPVASQPLSPASEKSVRIPSPPPVRLRGQPLRLATNVRPMSEGDWYRRSARFSRISSSGMSDDRGSVIFLDTNSILSPTGFAFSTDDSYAAYDANSLYSTAGLSASNVSIEMQQSQISKVRPLGHRRTGTAEGAIRVRPNHKRLQSDGHYLAVPGLQTPTNGLIPTNISNSLMPPPQSTPSHRRGKSDGMYINTSQKDNVIPSASSATLEPSPSQARPRNKSIITTDILQHVRFDQNESGSPLKESIFNENIPEEDEDDNNKID